MQERLIQTLPYSALKVLRPLRTAALIVAEPLDYIWRCTNGKKDFPPLNLRCRVGPLRSFEGSGGEFITYLKIICKLSPGESLLDIGCGSGLMALDLTGSQSLPEYLGESGKYVGGDIHKSSIKWCQRKISPKHSNCSFFHMDIKNRDYNPKGRYVAENYVFPFEDNSFDVILLKSVFTHMLPSAIENYLREISRLLSDRGRCLATFYLISCYNEEQDKLAEGNYKLHFRYGDENVRFISEDWPELAVGYEEEFIMNLFIKNGLVLNEPIKRGTWARRDGLSFQDMVILRRNS